MTTAYCLLVRVAEALSGDGRMVDRLYLVAGRVEQMEAVRAVAMGEGAVKQGHALCLEVGVPGVQLIDAVDDKAVVIHCLLAAAGHRSATQGEVVITTGQVDQVWIGAVQHLHAE